jgi:hypothetical protein
VARRPRGALEAGSCLTYRFSPWERVSADIKENVQPLPDDFLSFRGECINTTGEMMIPPSFAGIATRVHALLDAMSP